MSGPVWGPGGPVGVSEPTSGPVTPSGVSSTTAEDGFAEWVILELMGHRRLAGYLTEVEIAGRGFLRLEIPSVPPVTQLYNPTSVYAITPTTEDTARRVATLTRVAPVQPWELPPAALPESAPAEVVEPPW